MLVEGLAPDAENASGLALVTGASADYTEDVASIHFFT
jgi:hypothetical protein